MMFAFPVDDAQDQGSLEIDGFFKEIFARTN